MRKYTLIIIIFMLVLPQFRSVAQELDNKSRRIINNKICNLLDDYEKYGRLTNNLSYIIPEYKDKYKELFKKDAKVFCDIILANSLDSSVLIDDYIHLTEQFYPKGLGISIIIDRISLPKHIGGNKYSSSVQIEKTISGFSKYEIAHEDSFHLNILITYVVIDNQINDLKISEIKGQESGKFINLAITSGNANKPLKNYTISYKVGNKERSNLTNDEGKVKIENLSHKDVIELSFVSKQFYKYETKLPVNEFIKNRIFDTKEDPNLFHIALKKKKWNAGISIQLLNAGIDIGNNVYVNPEIQSITNSVNKGLGISANINYLLGFRNNTDWGLGAGIQFNSFSMTTNLDSWIDSYSDIDPSGMEYNRTVHLSNIEETGNFSFIEIPVTAFIRHGITEKLFLTSNIGVATGIVINATSESKAHGEYIGSYGPEMFYIEISDNRVYNFGNYDIKNSMDNELEFNYGVSLFVDIGIEYLLTDDLNLKIGGQFVPNCIEFVPEDSNEILSGEYSQLNSTLSGYNSLGFSRLNIYVGISKDF